MKKPSTISPLEAEMDYQMCWVGIAKPEQEHKFAKSIGRKWRFDFAWPDKMVALEVEGGTWTDGRHTRGSGFEKDCEKYNAAALLGWRVFRVTSGMIKSGAALKTIEEALK